jgi:transposase
MKEDVMQVVRIGLDLAKYVFEVHGVDSHGKVVVRKTLRRDAVAHFFANLPPCLVGMEASNGAHYWTRVLTEPGHQVRLISPQFVTPYVKSNKNDRNDAEAICEAVGRPSMRFVPPKSVDQLAVQAVHRIRRRLVADRVRLVNQIHGLLSEHGIVIARDITQLRRGLANIVGSSDDGLSDLVRSLMRELQVEMAELDQRITSYDRRIREIFRNSEQCQRLGKIEGIGPCDGDGIDCRRGRQIVLREWPPVCRMAGLGAEAAIEWRASPLVRHQQARRPLLRTLMIHGARAPWVEPAANRILAASGSASCGSADIPMLRLSRSPTKMRASCGPCFPAMHPMNRRCR